MTSTEQKVFDIIRRKKNARIQYIASTAGVSSGYAALICQGLHRRGHVHFSRGLAVMPASADTTAAESQISEPPAAPLPLVEEQIQEEVTPVSGLHGMNEQLTSVLAAAGYNTVGDLANVPLSKLMQAGRLNVKQAAGLINQAKIKVGMIKSDII